MALFFCFQLMGCMNSKFQNEHGILSGLSLCTGFADLHPWSRWCTRQMERARPLVVPLNALRIRISRLPHLWIAVRRHLVRRPAFQGKRLGYQTHGFAGNVDHQQMFLAFDELAFGKPTELARQKSAHTHRMRGLRSTNANWLSASWSTVCISVRR